MGIILLFLLVATAAGLVLYVALMLVFRAGWQQTKSIQPTQDFIPATKISIIIPARNEAANIGACLEHISQQDYPKNLLEIILVDDHSADETVLTARGFSSQLNLQIIRLSDYDLQGINAYKKEALTRGIGASSGSLIITTDADCTAPPHWIKSLAAAFEISNAKAIIAPVSFLPLLSLSGIFQSLDFMTMQGITAAVRFWKMGAMANGANFAFTRNAFFEVGGYEGTTNLASGDDYHLLQKLTCTFPEEIFYLRSKAAIVETQPQSSWAGFLQQRIRWASKGGKDGDGRLTALLVLVYLFNCGVGALIVAAIFVPGLRGGCLIMLALKTTAELFLLWPVSGFFNKRKELFLFPLLQPLHIAYIILAGFLGMIGKYQWKGRSVH